ncbi:MAG TPA: hypothetical protein VN239_04775 [Nitrososphaera sp.]|nr:hypothetical protein [Nitrososphaera sp.]
MTQSMRDEEKYTEKVWKEIEAEEKEIDYDCEGVPVEEEKGK